MALSDRPSTFPSSIFILVIAILLGAHLADASFTFKATRRASLVAKNGNRHRSRRGLLQADQIYLGGNISTMLVMEIMVGNTVYHPVMDTTTSLLWLNCFGCTSCPKASASPEFPLKLYTAGKDARNITCGESFCTNIHQDKEEMCRGNNDLCRYKVNTDADSSSAGYLVNDTMTLRHLEAQGEASLVNLPFVLGCGMMQEGIMALDESSYDGMLGLGHDNTSFVPQIAAQTNVPNKFSHCLDSKGSGIFTIGDLVTETDHTQTTPFDPKRPGYEMRLTGIDIAGVNPLAWSKDGSNFSRVAKIDVNEGLITLQKDDYKIILDTIYGDKKFDITRDTGFDCITFPAAKSYDEEKTNFPNITLILGDNARWNVTPDDYLMIPYCDGPDCPTDVKVFCLIIQPADNYILSGNVLADKIIHYDLEEHKITWTTEKYDCHSYIRVNGEGGPFNVEYKENAVLGASGAYKVGMGKSAFLLALSAILYSLI